MSHRGKGFTLIEMVGVVAVIGILAAVATPMVLDAITNARVSAYAQDLKTLRSAATRFYADTARFPSHRPLLSGTDNLQLLTNPSTPISGWSGPYLESEIAMTRTQTSGTYGIWTGRSESVNQFDLDGDGIMEVTTSTLLWFQMNDEDGRRLSDIIDGDGDVLSGDGAWYSAGTVKRQGASTNPTGTFIFYLADK